MALAPGVRLGAYEISSLLGSGGMGEVYRARDTKLQREVALKVLPEHFALDPDRLARFKREAQVLASLNHVNIAAIHGFEESDGVQALVLELVEGPTLADRIAEGAIPLDEALPIARQIADALEAAHEHGVIHRDLKPANIKLRPDGIVKVLDFGLAKAMEQGSGIGDRGSVDATQSATITSPAMTRMGVILGTAAYMAPEQAKGKAADARSDIWAFGVILLEMLTGKSVFGGETMVEILGGVLKTDPDWTDLPVTTPPIIRSLIRRCLQKDRNRRLRDIADARFQIEEALNEPARPAAAVVTPARKSRERLLWAAAMLVAVAATAAIPWYFRPAPIEAPEMRLQIVTPPANNLTSLAISPDGRQVAFEAAWEGKRQLWLRPLESETAKPLGGTDNGTGPFWSPDSRSLGFFSAGELKRIDISGGAAQTLARAFGGAGGGSWNADGIILFAPLNAAPIYRISAGGGAPTSVTRLESPQQGGHRFPYFLPDGRHFLFFATGTSEVQGVYMGSLESTETRRLFAADTKAVFAPPDYVLFMRQDRVFAQRLDLRTFEPAGDAFPVAERLAEEPGGIASIALSASAAGLMAYRSAVAEPRQLIWFDRAGKRTSIVGEPDINEPNLFRLSADGKTVAFERRVSGNRDVWLIEVSRGLLRRLTSDVAIDSAPIWSPDGQRVAFQSYRRGLFDLYLKLASGVGTEEVLLETSENKNISDWSSDGRFILYSNQGQKTARDLWALPFGDRKPFVVVQTDFEETNGRFSPDGRWIAYQSNETGRPEIYIHPFPKPGPTARISTNAGTNAQWRSDGREIFYIAPDNRLMAVPVTLNADRGSVEAGTPVPLFTLRPGSQYAASPDGQRFLVNTPVGEASTPPITIVLNWKPRAQGSN